MDIAAGGLAHRKFSARDVPVTTTAWFGGPLHRSKGVLVYDCGWVAGRGTARELRMEGLSVFAGSTHCVPEWHFGLFCSACEGASLLTPQALLLEESGSVAYISTAAACSACGVGQARGHKNKLICMYTSGDPGTAGM